MKIHNCICFAIFFLLIVSAPFAIYVAAEEQNQLIIEQDKPSIRQHLMSKSKPKPISPEYKYKVGLEKVKVKVVLIGNCEYIDNVFTTYHGRVQHVYTHKGDCRNPIHKGK